MPTKLTNQNFTKYHVMDNALIFPANNLRINRSSVIPGIKNSAYNIKYSLSKNIKENFDKKSLKKYLKKNPAIKISGAYLYLGVMHQHFGHFMTESTMTMYSSAYFGKNLSGIIAIPEKEFVKDNEVFLTVCTMMQINPKNIIFIESITEVEKLIIPEIGAYPGSKIKAWYLEELANRIDIKAFKDSKLPKKIFIKKSSIFINRLMGLSYFSKLLTENGFCLVYPERYSFKEQLSFVINANMILWEEGSACHIVDILPSMPKTKSFIIKRRYNNSWTDESIRNKFPNLVIYNDMREFKVLSYMMSNGKILYSAMSFLRHPKILHHKLIEQGFIKQSNFKFFIFKIFEAIDAIKNVKEIIALPIKYFLVYNVKKYIHIKIWKAFKKIFFFL